MAQQARCRLPSFGATFEVPRRPVSIKARTTPAQKAELLAAFEKESLDALLKTAWGLLLYLYTGSEDIYFGYQHLGPGRFSESGLLACTLAVNGRDSLQNLVENFGGVHDYDKTTGHGGDSGANNGDYSLFDTVVMVRVCGERANGGTSVRSVLPKALPEDCQARLHVKVLEEEVCIFLEWWNTEISTTQMESVVGYFEYLLEQALFNRDLAVSDAARLLDHDWSRICRFNSLKPEYCDRCIHDLIHEKARVHPERQAVSAWDGNLTYEELDLLATKLAVHLQSQGVGPEARVALCFDKSKWNMVAMLGVLKAGGAFVPLDPTHPTPRLRSLVESVDGRVMLCSRNRAELLGTVVENLIPLDEQLLNEVALSSEAINEQKPWGNTAAYLIFTSGSTGQPKGTLLEHRAFVSGALAYGPLMDMDSGCRMLQFASHTFDASLFESLSPLIHGGCVCIPSDGERLNGIIETINRMKVNVVCLTPSFVRFLDPSTIPGVKTMILAGEAMTRGDLEQWSHIKLVNAYGPTEASVCAAANTKIHPESDPRDIGLPTGVNFWVVNPHDHNQLVPIGSPGELLLEGPTLARCYINNPTKTNEAFIGNPAWTRQNSSLGDRRFYKTGDLVRYNSDAGSLMFIGRKDTQIKLHGQRIELGEIENSIGNLPKIKHCLAFLCKSGFAKGKLVAVVSLHYEISSNTETLKSIPDSEKALIVPELRGQLAQRLPTYMIPAVWLCVEALPLLPSGKLNRKEIVTWASTKTAEPDGQKLEQTPVHSTTENPVEDRLASIWSRVLDIPRRKISMEEGFLALGGDSIAAITCMGYCRKQGLGLTVQDVLQSKSIRDLAARVQESRQPVIYEEGTKELFDLSPIQKLHFMIRKEGQGYFNQGVRTRLNGKVSELDLRHAIETIIRRHSMLRARLVSNTTHDFPQQHITEEVDSSYRMRVHDIKQEHEMEGAIADSQSCIDAFNGPVLCVDLFQANDGNLFLSMVAHHLVVDIVSWRIILEDLEEILLHPTELELCASSLPFPTWCHLQDERTQTLGQNLGSLPAADLAYWGMENQVPTYGEVVCESFELDFDDSYLILMGCHKALQTEPIDILLASLLHSFGKTFKDRPLPIIYNEGHGREVWDSMIDISRTVGWFTTLFPISIPAQGANTPVAAATVVKDIRRCVPDNGRQNFASRMSATAKNGKKTHPCPMEMTFNYVGQHRDLQRQDGLFQLMNQMAGETAHGGGASDFGRDTPRFALFEISALALNGRLRFIFSFSKSMQHQDTIRRWITCCKEMLRLLGKSLQSLPPRLTLSDLPMLSLTYEELENLQSNKLPKIGITSLDLIEDIYPCSRMQQGILLARSLDRSLYAVHDTYEVKAREGKPNISRLKEAWQIVVSRHAMLRTLFVENLTSQDVFCQVVLKNLDSSPIHLSCSNDSEVLSKFNGQGPPQYSELRPHHRLTICETPKGKLFFRLDLSHAAMDGVSISVILRDLQLAYDSKLDHRRPLFKSFMRYLREVPQDSSMDYWRMYLADFKPCLFPMLNDGKTLSQKLLRTKRLNFGSFGALQRLCEKRHLTLSTAFNAAWGLTLCLFTGSNDVCFSYMASLRDSPVEDIDSVVGPVINLLACRLRISDDDSLKDILQRVQDDCMQQLSYNTLSLIDIQHELKISDTALLNTGVSYQKMHVPDDRSTPSLQLTQIDKIQDPAEYPVFLNVVASNENVDIQFNYWTNNLSDEQAENVTTIYLKYLEDIVRHHEEQVGRLEPLSEHNKQTIRRWNRHLIEEAEICVHDVIREKSVAQPDSPAIISWDGDLTYSELEGLSSRLANYLLRLGVHTGTFVPIQFNKSAWQVVSILAVLKAGAICVPREAAHEKTWLDKWLVDNGAHIVLTSVSDAELLEEVFPVVIAVDDSLFDSLPSLDASIHSQVHLSDHAYVVFNPEECHHSSAVLLDQRAVTSRADAFASAVCLDSNTRLFQYAAYTSDLFLQETFGTLMHGGCLCIAKDVFTGQLSELINETNANFISLTPSVASRLSPTEVPRIQALALWGEPVTRKVCDMWFGKVRLHSFFGATECSITCINNSNFDKQAILPTIGLGIGCRSWLVDPLNSDRLVPVGCVGELLIEGPGMSCGYLCDESKTKARFIEKTGGDGNSSAPQYSLSAIPRPQMFKTGYLARYNSDGTLVYMGRKAEASKQNAHMSTVDIESLLQSLELPGYHCIVEAIDLQNEGNLDNCAAVFILPTTGRPKVVEARTNVIAAKTDEMHQLMAKVQSYLSSLSLTCRVPSLYFPVEGLPLTTLGILNRPLLREAAQALSSNSLLEYNIRIFGEFWRRELEKPTRAGQLLQPLSVQEPPALRISDRVITIPWNNPSQEVNLRPALLCAWSLAVHSYTQCDDIIFGDMLLSSESNDRAEATMVPRRVRIDKTGNIAGLLNTIVSSISEAEPFQKASLPSIRTINTDTARACDFQTILSVSEMSAHQQRTCLENLEAKHILHSELSVSPLAVFCCLEETELHLAARFDVRALFPSQAERLLDLFAEYLNFTQSAMGLQEKVANLVGRDDSLHVFNNNVNYWKAHLAGVEPCLFPALSPKKVQSRFKTETLRLTNVAKVQSACKTLSTSPSFLLQVVWGLVVRCYTGLEEICFGYCVSSKKSSAGILPCRFKLDDGLEIREVLQRRREDVDRMLKHPMALSEIQRAAGSENSSIFNTAFRYKKCSAGVAEFSSIVLQSVDDGLSECLIVVSVSVSGSSADVNFEYQPTSLSRSDMSSIIDCFESVLNSILTLVGPGCLIRDVQFIGRRSCQNMAKWNASLPDQPKRCAHEIIQGKTSAQPSAPAICSWDGEFTYAQLDTLSTKLAYYLTARGIGPEVFVALCFEKSAWAVISQLAVLRAGGAFASLDPTHPEGRLQNLVSDIGAPIVLCSPRYLEKVSRISNTVLAVSKSAIEQLRRPSIARQFPSSNANNAAYAIFTSGTTGRPKVAVLEHAALGTASSSFAAIFGMGPDTRALQFSSYTFDVSILETIIVLMTGGCVCIPSDDERLNDLTGAIRRMEVNLISCTPSVSSTLVPDSVPSLRTIINGGEKLTESIITRWAGRTFFNAYGPAEATIIATASLKMDETGERLDDDSNSIGRAVHGRTWVVDPHNHQRLLPVGAVGELVLEGCNIARGYLNNEEKTRGVFINRLRWTHTPELEYVLRHSQRMYRTGDLVRYRSDGSLCFISRMDTQIKLNGQRIELEEIEQQCVLALPAGTQVAVDIVVPETKTVARALAAFITVEGREAKSSSEVLLPMSESIQNRIEALHKSLNQVLPQVMIPKLYFPVRCLPLGTTGKLDRRGLREMVQSLSKEVLTPYMISKSGSGRVPEHVANSTLRELWGVVLDLEPDSIGTGDNFFGLGGDSFSAMKLVGAARSRGISLRVADIYEHPILADMTECCADCKVSVLRPDLDRFALVPDPVPIQDILTEISDQYGFTEESISDMYPCSAVQEGLLALSIQQGGAYVARPVFKLAADVDLGRFRAAWQQAVDEFDILRTRIVHTEAAGFLQVVLHKERISWTIETSFGDLMEDTFEGNGGALARYAIVQLGPSVRHFVWIVHHALYDGWNIPQILRRVEEIYSDSPLENATVPYKFFINHLLQRALSQSDEFWRSYLDGLSCMPFPPHKDQRSNTIQASSTQRSSVNLVRPSDAADITVPELIRAAWAIVISAHTGCGDVCFGETLMGRNIDMPDIAAVAGPVLTTVPMRVRVDNRMSLTQYLYDVRQTTATMIPHQHSGLQRIQKLSADAAAACSFQNLLVIQSDNGQLNTGIWSSESEQPGGDFFTHPLVVECKLSSSELNIVAHHDELALEGWRAERLIGQFSFVIEQLLDVSRDSSITVGGVDVVSPLEKRDIASWNKRQVTSIERCAHEIIREQSLAQPEAPAICSWDGELTYQEMFAHASYFAAYLVSCGVGPETLIPICVDKSLWAVVTILSVLLAGGAFVPLDPSHPTSRHREILEEINADIILCSPQHRSRYMGSVSTIISVSKETISGYSAIKVGAEPHSRVTPSNMAYAIFTSGSTGRPKGIIIDHRALCSSTMAFAPVMHMDKDSRVFQFASFTFDAAIGEVLAALMRGACVCIPSEEERLNDLTGAMQRLKVTWTFLTPSLACIIEPSTVPSLKVLACGGEKLSREVVAKWANRVRLIGGYGPTETVVFALLSMNLIETGFACIGFGIPCTLTWIVDPDNHDRLTPLGAVGELALEGPSLAREYLNNPKKTEEAFVYEPAWIKCFPSSFPSPRRIYKTGDLVKYNMDGSIEYIGRKDHQVKLRGQRMELGEIEHRLLENKSIRHAVVIVPQSGHLQKKLVAVVSLNSLTSDSGKVSSGACELISQKDMVKVGHRDISAIRKNIESQLPVYMVPEAWAVVKSLPMLVSGKLDRKKIAGWLEWLEGSAYDRVMQDYDSLPLDAVEEEEDQPNGHSVTPVLRDIFAQVLNLPLHKVDSSRSFINLGGDSISGMAVVSKARKLGLNLPLNRVLRSKSIDELATSCEAKLPGAKNFARDSSVSFGLSPVQELFFRVGLAAPKTSTRFNQSITLRLTRKVQPSIIKDAIRAVVCRHSMFRARFSRSLEGVWLQTITEVRFVTSLSKYKLTPMQDVDSSYTFRNHSVKSASEMSDKQAFSQCSVDVQTGPMFAADLFDKGGQQILFLTASHLCVDMVSWRVVLEELQDFIVTGSLSSDAPLSFQAWCNAQLENSKTSSGIIDVACELPDIDYWGMSHVPNQYGNVHMESFMLDKHVTAFLTGQCHAALRTETVEVLVAAVLHSFHQVFTDRGLPTIYSEGHGRETWDSSMDPSSTVGWFTTMFPLHVKATSSFFDTLRRVKDIRRRVAGNSRAFFARNILHSDADKFPVPFEILFNYLGQIQQLERADTIFHLHGDVFNAESLGASGDMGPETPRFSLFEITALIVEEKLHVSFTYNRNMRHQIRIQAWIAECKRLLETDLLDLSNNVPEPTLSDYPLLSVTYEGLKNVTEEVLPRLGIACWDQVEDIYPCSPVQEGILLSQLRDPQGYIFNAVFEVRCSGIRGGIDISMLKKAWSMVIGRHSVLRTVFIDSNCKGSSFDQVVIKKTHNTASHIECDDSEAFETLDAITLSSRNESPNLCHQVVFCKTSAGRVLMKLEMNHAIIDGGSTAILLKDLALAYSNQLPPGPGPLFSNYIKHIREETQSGSLDYWTRYLSDVRPCHLLVPEGKGSPRVLGSHMMEFNGFTELQRFCEDNSITLANLTLAAWAIVLRGYTGSDDVCFGYPSTGRDLPVPGIQEAVGIFINTLCCRVRFRPGQTLLDVSRSAQDDYFRSLPHQQSSLAQIQHALGGNVKNLFNTCVSIQNHAGDDMDKAEISFELLKAYDPTEYPITVNVETGRGREGILLRYWADAVSENEAAELAQAIAKVFTCFVENQNKPVFDLKLGNESPTAAEQLLDRSSLEKIVDERIKVIINEMVMDGKISKSMIKDQNGDLPDSLLSLDKDTEGSLQALVVAKQKTPLPHTLADEYRAPTHAEKQLWRLWSITLGLPPHPIKHRDSFFKLGGDSIAAMKLVGAAREEGLTLSVSDVFKKPIFEDMLAFVSGKTNPVASHIQPKHEEFIEKPVEETLTPPCSESSQEITILRPIEVDEPSLRAAICPKVGVFKGGIVDVLPVTDFQSLSIAGTMFESRWMLNYFFLEGKGSLDIRRLRESFLRVVDAFDILRTVFVSFHGQFFQVVLRKIRPEIFVHETDKSFDEYTKSLQQRDRNQPPGQGEQCVQFYIVKRANSDEHRILMRISHAQFDGVCLPKIMSAIKMAYEGSPVQPSSFLNYMRVLPASITPEHYQHWTELLKGSRMTQIVQRDRPNNYLHVGGFAEQKRIIEIPSSATENVTIATVMQSAWAITLAKVCAQDDVVFGLTVNGRNGTVPGAENTVGPCLNFIPVRVRFRDRWTGLDLFRYLQDQQVANMPYESLGYREIIRRCTDWPDSTFFTTSVLHQNVDYEGQMRLDSNTYRMGGVGVIDNLTDLTLFSKPVAGQPTQITVSLGYSLKGPMHPAFVSTVLEMVCDTAQSLVANPNTVLPSPSTLRSLPSQLVEDTPISMSDSDLLSSLNDRSLSELLAHSDLLTHIWQQILPPRRSTGKPRASFHLDSSFFQLGGDLMNMAQVVWIIEQETSLHVRLEDLLAHPTFLGHMAVVALYTARRDAESVGPTTSETIPAYVPAADTAAVSSVSEREMTPRALAKSESWTALAKARVFAKKITKFGGSSARA
ncbi:hypothetical protein BJX61DRAFT_548394 [Aspergillus egyptiacus]|nr:hypothetical protein BJX61DRAFT_548394 [Aspergillus egyptiacus]